MSAAKPIELVSPDAYLAGELLARHKHEYCAGLIYMMAGANTQHNRITTNATGTLHARLRGKLCEAFNSDAKVRIRSAGETWFYYPDAMVVCESNPPGDVVQDKPVVIVEVLSKSTRRVDEYEKREAYLTIPTLSAYLLVETTSPRVVVYERDAPGGGFTPRAYEGLDATIPLDTAGIELPLAELYERVDFAAAAEEEAADADEE
ncbi:MAG TPA: Uma2 family endonuclease [Tepidisphaeraceae bacterium]|jgi:Uma2 family endonuclease